MDKFVERPVDRDAEIGTAGVGIELVQRLELEDVAGIDRIGVAQPGLDLRHREPARPRGERRPGCGRRQWPVMFGPVDLLGGGLDRLVRPERMIESGGAQYRIEAQQPTRRHGRHTLLPRGAGQHHLRRPEGLDKVMRGDTDRAFWDGDAELAPHRPRHPRVVLGRTGPAAFVEPAEDE